MCLRSCLPGPGCQSIDPHPPHLYLRALMWPLRYLMGLMGRGPQNLGTKQYLTKRLDNTLRYSLSLSTLILHLIPPDPTNHERPRTGTAQRKLFTLRGQSRHTSWPKHLSGPRKVPRRVPRKATQNSSKNAMSNKKEFRMWSGGV